MAMKPYEPAQAYADHRYSDLTVNRVTHPRRYLKTCVIRLYLRLLECTVPWYSEPKAKPITKFDVLGSTLDVLIFSVF